MALLTRDQILAADDLPRQLVLLPEWGGEAYVRTLSGAERDHWEAGIRDEEDEVDVENIRARFAVLVLVDDTGKRLFSDADAEALGQKAGPALDRIYQAAAKLNKLKAEDV